MLMFLHLICRGARRPFLNIFEDHQGSQWVVGSEKGVVKSDPSSTYYVLESSSSPLASDHVVHAEEEALPLQRGPLPGGVERGVVRQGRPLRKDTTDRRGLLHGRVKEVRENECGEMSYPPKRRIFLITPGKRWCTTACSTRPASTSPVACRRRPPQASWTPAGAGLAYAW